MNTTILLTLLWVGVTATACMFIANGQIANDVTPEWCMGCY
jgi:hypothetical protein